MAWRLKVIPGRAIVMLCAISEKYPGWEECPAYKGLAPVVLQVLARILKDMKSNARREPERLPAKGSPVISSKMNTVKQGVKLWIRILNFYSRCECALLCRSCSLIHCNTGCINCLANMHVSRY